jgi:hypothetical protein
LDILLEFLAGRLLVDQLAEHCPLHLAKIGPQQHIVLMKLLNPFALLLRFAAIRTFHPDDGLFENPNSLPEVDHLNLGLWFCSFAVAGGGLTLALC